MANLNNSIFIVQRIEKYSIRLLIKYLWIRYKVYVGEYQRPIIKEFNIVDITAEHYILLLQQRVIGTVRIIYKANIAEIGRVAILEKYRNKGYGSELIRQIISMIKNSRKANLISLYTDNDKVNFYEKFGFVENGEVFFDNMPYINMVAKI